MADTKREGTGRSGEFTDALPTFLFTSPGDLTTTDNALIPWIPGRDKPISGATAQVKTAPVGADILIDLRLGTRTTGVMSAAFATITIPDGSLTATITFTGFVPTTAQFLAAEITQIGSGTPGANLTVEVY